MSSLDLSLPCPGEDRAFKGTVDKGGLLPVVGSGGTGSCAGGSMSFTASAPVFW